MNIEQIKTHIRSTPLVDLILQMLGVSVLGAVVMLLTTAIPELFGMVLFFVSVWVLFYTIARLLKWWVK